MELNAVLLDHFDDPRGGGGFDAGEPEVLRGEAGSERHGARVRMELKRGADDRIVEARFKAWGCAGTIACASLVVEWLNGRRLTDAAALDVKTLAAPLELPPERMYAPLVVEDALRAALETEGAG